MFALIDSHLQHERKIMNTHRAILVFCLTVMAVVGGVVSSTLAQYPGSGQVPLNASAVPRFVDPLPHFAYPGARVDATTPGTPLTVEAMALDVQALSTGTVLPNGTVVGPASGLTHVWGYRTSNGAVSQGPYWPGFTVEAMRGVPLDVLYLNQLDESYDAVNIAADQTLHWAMGMSPGEMTPYTGPVPIVFHLHGGEVPPWSDGGPDAWYTPGGAMAGNAALTNVYRYPNTQEAATLWFHDHALGATRLNVYAGLAAFYFLRDAGEDALNLPGWSGDGMVQEIDRVTGEPHGDTYLPEIEIALQDRMFDQNGQLYLPAVGDNPTVHPYWLPEFLGNIMTVNSKSWPYLSVAPRKYRFRLLGGSNARFYDLWLEDVANGTPGPAIQVIGTDGGLLDAPVALDPAMGERLLIAPGERYDVVIDFSAIPAIPGQTRAWTLVNKAGAPFDKGEKPKPFETGQIMQFVVNGEMVGADASVVTGRPTPLEQLADFATGQPAVPVDTWRQLTLNEVIGAGGPLEVLVNNTKWNGESARPYDDFTDNPSGLTPDLYSELFTEGETEVFQIINLTADAHPIHFHLVQYQLLSRQRFNVKRYEKQYEAAFQAAGQPGFVGAWGPPLDYNTGMDPDGMQWTTFLGGNPDVTPYLQGPAYPALPEEQGWKDTFVMYPGEVTTVILRFTPQDATATGQDYFEFDPSGSGGYVWHCHIVDHEDNEMMRPTHVYASADAPAGRLDEPMYPGYWNVHPDAVFAAREAMDGTTASGSDAPMAFALGQNRPNPFNPVTEISFALPEASHVTLEIYNSAGRKVATLIDAQAPAGLHKARLDAGDLPSGVYFYQLNAGGFTERKKMLLLK
jgi:spore coat protein A